MPRTCAISALPRKSPSRCVQGSCTTGKRKAGSRCFSPPTPAKWADVLMVLAPDEHQAGIWENDIKGHLKPGSALAFAHGLNVHFGLIEAPSDIDVIMIAPKGPGHTVRSEYQRGAGVPCLVAVHQDATGNALEVALCLCVRLSAAVVRASSRRPSSEECETDLFGEQAVLVRRSGRTLIHVPVSKLWSRPVTRRKWPISSVCHEVKLIVDLIYEGGIANMRYSVSNTAEYGDYVSGPRVITADTKARMKDILTDIQTGRFVRELHGRKRHRSGQFQGIASSGCRARRRSRKDRGRSCAP